MKYTTNQDINLGKLIDPIDRIKLMSPDQWETLTKEWLEAKNDSYVKIENFGGAGDMGRDVVTYIDAPKNNNDYKWECYQCKHYNHPLHPSDIWIEFGKIIYYSFKNKFPIPKKYYFVAPKGIGNKLSLLLNDSSKLKNELKESWNQCCQKKITESDNILLENEFLQYFNNFPFDIFYYIEPETIVREHKKHPNHLQTFGGRLPQRNIKSDTEILEDSIDEELRYVKQLLKAYNSDSEEEIENINLLKKDDKYDKHFERARKSFYHAEELRLFSRDNISEENYDLFKSDIYEGVVNTAESDFENGFKKVKAVETESTKITINSNPLKETCRTIEKKGVCHQLVNDNEITWVDEDEE